MADQTSIDNVLQLVPMIILVLLAWFVNSRNRKSKDSSGYKKTLNTSPTSRIKRYEGVTLHAIGASTYDNDVRDYAYIEFKDSKGQIIPVSKSIRVENNVGVNFNPGVEGSFYFAQQFGHYRLLASKVGGEKRVVRSITFTGFAMLLFRILNFPSDYPLANIAVYMISLGFLLLIPIVQTIVDVYQGIGLRRELRSLGFQVESDYSTAIIWGVILLVVIGSLS